MNKKILEVLNHILQVFVYSYLLFKSIYRECFSMSDSIISLVAIVMSIMLMFYLWGVKE